MSYTPTNWKSGDVISAEKLNKLEQGVAECCGGGGSEPLIVNATTSMFVPDMVPTTPGGTEAHRIATDDAVTIDASFEDIKQALDSGNEVVVHLVSTTVAGDGYEVLRLSTYAGPVGPLFPGTFSFSRQHVGIGEDNFGGIVAYTLNITPTKNTLLVLVDGHTTSGGK